MAAGKFGRATCQLSGFVLASLICCQATAQQAPKPRRDRWEVGFLADALFLSRFHNLKADGKPQYEFKWPAVLVGGRAAYFPEKFLGFELEAAFGYGVVGKRISRVEGDLLRPADVKPPRFIPVRAHVIGQVPGSRLVPFALLGGGVLHAKSSEMGSDADLLLDLGIGAKYMVTQHVVPRLDLRLDMTQREGGGFSEGVALHGEVMLGISVNFGVH